MEFTIASYLVCLGLYDYRCLVSPIGCSLGTLTFPFPAISANIYAANCSSIQTARYEYVTTRCNAALDLTTDTFSKVWPLFLVYLLMAYSRSTLNQRSMEGKNQPAQEIGTRWHFYPRTVHGMYSHHQDLGGLERPTIGSHLVHMLGSDREFSWYDTLDH